MGEATPQRERGDAHGAYAAPSSVPGKRSVSAAGFANPGTPSGALSTPQHSSKRPLVSSVLATAPRGSRSASQTHAAEAPATPLGTASPNAQTSPRPTPDSAKYELQMLRNEYERRVQFEQRAYQTLESQFRSQSRELEALRCQRVESQQEWEAERAVQRQQQDEWKHTKASLEDQLIALRSETMQLRASHDALQTERDQGRAESQRAVSELNQRLVQLQSKADEAEAQRELLQRSNDALRKENSELEQAAREARSSQPAEAGGDQADLADQLSQQVQQVQKLEARNDLLSAENARLAEQSSKTQVLREANRTLEGRLKRADALQEQLLEKENELRTANEKHEHWVQLLRGGIEAHERDAFAAAANVDEAVPSLDAPDPLDAESLPPYVSRLRGIIMGCRARIEGLSHSIEQLRSSNLELSLRAEQRGERETHLTKELTDKSAALARAERTREIQSEELERYRALVESFEQESRQGNSSYDGVQSERVAALEKRLAELQQANETLTAQVHEAEQRAEAKPAVEHEAPSGAPTEALVQAQRALADQQAHTAALEKQYAALEKECEQLWSRVGRGEFDQSRQHCLVLKDNPVARDYAIRSSTLDALKKENEGLLAQVNKLHEQLAQAGPAPQSAAPAAGGSDQALVPLQTAENMRAEIAQLHETLHAKEKGMLRLKQVFTAKANEFREAVQSLFGYKLRFLENGKVKLTSAYARGARVTTLVFQSDDGNVGHMKLQGEAMEGLANVAHLRDYWLSDGVRHSVPCFLAALNLELYENTTQALRGNFTAGDEDE